jgi:DNA-binding NarL/FixJ family response regulator
MNNEITVSLVEDNPGFRSALLEALAGSPLMKVVHVATDFSEGMALLDQQPTDVLLVDLELPGGDGYEVIAGAATAWPDCKIMVISVFDEGHKIIPAIELGAEGYIIKGGGMEEIQHQIQRLLDGENPMSPSVAKCLMGRVREAKPAVTLATAGGVLVQQAPAQPEEAPTPEINADNEKILLLPRQELETIHLIAKGCTAAEVAAHMEVSETTVRTYLRRIYFRLNVNNKLDALRELGLIDDIKPLVALLKSRKRRKSGNGG